MLEDHRRDDRTVYTHYHEILGTRRRLTNPLVSSSGKLCERQRTRLIAAPGLDVGQPSDRFHQRSTGLVAACSG